MKTSDGSTTTNGKGMKTKGKAFKYGSHVDTDVIIPARYLNSSDPQVLSKYCMVDIDDTFAQKVGAGDVIVALQNFGCGSSREHAPIAIKASGVACVIAVSFSRIFYRNAINIGLPIFECEAAAQGIEAGDQVRIDYGTGEIENITKGQVYQAQPFPSFIQEIMAAGGLIAYTKGVAK